MNIEQDEVRLNNSPPELPTFGGDDTVIVEQKTKYYLYNIALKHRTHIDIKPSDPDDKVREFFYKLHKYGCVVEQQQMYDDKTDKSGITLDLDIFQDTPVPQVRREHLERTITFIRITLVRMLKLGTVKPRDNKDICVFVTQRPRDRSALDNDEGKLIFSDKHKSFKDGYHIIIPEVHITKMAKRYLIDELRANAHKLFEGITTRKYSEKAKGYKDISLMDIFDRASAHAPPLLFTQSKPVEPGMKPNVYVFYTLYICELRKPDTPLDHTDGDHLANEYRHILELEMSINKWLPNERQITVNIRDYDLQDELAANLEIIRAAEEAKKKEFTNCMDNLVVRIMRDGSYIRKLKEFLARVLATIPADMAVETTSWKKVLFALNSITEALERGFPELAPTIRAYMGELAVFFSKRGGKAFQSETDVLRLFNSPCRGGTVMTLIYYITDEAVRKQFCREYYGLFPKIKVQPVQQLSLEYADDTNNLYQVPDLTEEALFLFLQKTIVIVNSGNFATYFERLKDINSQQPKWTPHPSKGGPFSDRGQDRTIWVKNPEFDANQPEDVVKNNRKKPVSLYEFIQKYKSYFRHYKGICWEPYLKEKESAAFQNQILNTWIPYQYADRKDLTIDRDRVDIINNHIKYCFCSEDGGKTYNEELYTFLIKLLAFRIRFPNAKPKVALAIINLIQQAAAKSLFCIKFLFQLIGESACLVQKNFKGLENQFNAEFANKLLVVFDELPPWSGRQETWETIKHMITESKMQKRQLYKEAIAAVDNSMFIFLSNNLNGLPIEHSQRRIVVLQASDHLDGNEAYFTKLATAMGFDTRENIRDHIGFYSYFQFLLEQNIDDWMPNKHLPQTKLKAELQEYNMGQVDQYVQHAMQIGETYLSYAQFDTYCTANGIKQTKIQNRSFWKELKTMLEPTDKWPTHRFGGEVRQVAILDESNREKIRKYFSLRYPNCDLSVQPIQDYVSPPPI